MVLGNEKGQATFIAVCSKNRLEVDTFFHELILTWIISELAAYSYSDIIVSLYDTLGAEARTFITSMLADEASKVPSLKHIIVIEPFSEELKVRAEAAGISVHRFSEVEKLPKPEDISTVCYTSGTTGTPEGVILTHANVIAGTTCLNIFANLKITSEVMSEVNKSVFTRLLCTVAMACKKNELRCGILRQDSFFDQIVFKKTRDKFGGHVRLMTIGSAPVAPDVLIFVRAAFGCIVIQGYYKNAKATEETLDRND
ncbi:unnamed protein product [Anisakis simplex]|uniref:long-chain-fatty-acid--CoA ligase n=1 Tax=Anisakis simplex TaxID=6269 RepID=A0A3P6SVL3_ANISI|nr:unnamed protein product [Anisakis simplex]